MTVVAAAKYEIIQVVSRLHSGSVHLDRIGNPKRSDLPMMSDDDQKDLRPDDGACPQAGIASKTMCADNAKKISTNSNKQVGNMLISEDHKL